MHIPDGLLSTPVIAGTYLITAGTVLYASKKAKDIPEEKLPLLGLTAAAIFVAQMVNFPVMAGVSGHLLGAALVAILFGPYASVLVMTAVLIIQTFLFGDGGVTALGANIFNMGIIGAFVGYYTYHYLKKTGTYLASFLAGWISVMLGALAASIEIGISGIVPFVPFLTLMLTYHSVIGVIEGVLTMVLVKALQGEVEKESLPSEVN